jgi:hypothetical protein
MSLIITSSSKGVGETNQIGISRPEQYKNHMKNTLRIPPNSEIAVESVKVNRMPMLDNGANMVGNFWFGERLTGNASFGNSLSYMIPTENEIGTSLAPQDFANEYVKTLKEAYSFHPEIDSPNIEMNVSTNTNGVFTGFDFKIPQVHVDATSVVPPLTTDVFMINGRNNVANITWDGTTLTSSDDNSFGQLQPRASEGGPISLYNGSLTYSDLRWSQEWTMGLSRPYVNDPSNTPSADDWDTTASTKLFKGESGMGIGVNGDDFYDYAAEVSSDGYLRLYHAIPDKVYDGADWESPVEPNIVMEEIIYYQKASGSFTADNKTNSSFATGTPIVWSASYGDLVFGTIGEKVTISVSGNIVVTPFSDASVNASTKGQVPKPIGQTCWKMYPTFSLWADGDTADIDVYNCRTESTLWNNQPENSWITRSIYPVPVLPENGSSVLTGKWNNNLLFYDTSWTPAWNNALFWGYSIDIRDVYRPYEAADVTPDTAVFGGTIRAYRGLSSKIIEDYENIFIMGKSERYMDRSLQQWQPNNQFTLGFYPMSINPNSSMTGAGSQFGAYFHSAQRPSLMSQHSMFIRVPTFTHETYNFGTGNPSKILFQVPRFDNAGTETGALYYQNNDKTYVDLHNTDELRITELDVHMVKKDETFVNDLTGSTEIVFHVRPRK